MRIVRGIVSLGLVAALCVGCDDSPTSGNPTDNINPIVEPDTTQPAGPEIFRAVMTGAEEVPAVTTTARGSVSFHWSADGSSLVYAITVNDISDVTAAHIHIGARGVAGPPVVMLYSSAPSGPYDGLLVQGPITSTKLMGSFAGRSTNDVLQLIASGDAYVNVHTTGYPGGEIRGQITPAPSDGGPQ